MGATVYVMYMECNNRVREVKISKAGPGQFAALGKILPGAPYLTLVNINQRWKVTNYIYSRYCNWVAFL